MIEPIDYRLCRHGNKVLGQTSGIFHRACGWKRVARLINHAFLSPIYSEIVIGINVQFFVLKCQFEHLYIGTVTLLTGKQVKETVENPKNTTNTSLLF